MPEILLPKNMSEVQRARAPHRITIDEECIIWTGAKASGYGVYNVRGHLFSLHRQVWIDYRGSLESWEQIDHVKSRGCKSRACFNLDHLEPVTQGENGRRGDGPSGIHSRQSHCDHGHLLSGENLNSYKSKDGYIHRLCKTCHRRRAREQYQRIKLKGSN